jgi:hypothetical protein
LENENIGEEEAENSESKEYFPCFSRRKASRTVHEEKYNKEILLGSQQTIPKMIGGLKYSRNIVGNAANKGGAHLNPLK